MTRKLTRRHFLNGVFYSSISMPLIGCHTANLPFINRILTAPLPEDALVLAAGDSLTYGTGAPPGGSYPYMLAKMTDWNVINAGIAGDTSMGVLRRLPMLLLRYKPKLVIICIGINDFTLGIAQDVVKKNIHEICQQVQSSGAAQLLVSVPYMTQKNYQEGSLKNAPIYAELAKHFNILLQKNALLKLVTTESMRSDWVHGNAMGYRYLALEIAFSLHSSGLLDHMPNIPKL